MPEPDVVMTGLTLGESPRWHDGRLWVWLTGESAGRSSPGNSTATAS